MVAKASSPLVRTLVAAAGDIINGVIFLTKSQFRELRPYSKELDRLANGRPKLRESKELLQTGGFIGAIIKPLLAFLPTAISAISGAVKRGRARRALNRRK
jgi:hypothetical protein